MSARSISVVIATYNRGARIGRTLDSVLRQTKPVSEIVVSDDGSTDKTAAWIGSNYPTVWVLTSPNAGTSTARNRGAEAASGEVLVFLDHDDEITPERAAPMRTPRIMAGTTDIARVCAAAASMLMRDTGPVMWLTGTW